MVVSKLVNRVLNLVAVNLTSGNQKRVGTAAAIGWPSAAPCLMQSFPYQPPTYRSEEQDHERDDIAHDERRAGRSVGMRDGSSTRSTTRIPPLTGFIAGTHRLDGRDSLAFATRLPCSVVSTRLDLQGRGERTRPVGLGRRRSEVSSVGERKRCSGVLGAW
jgi:hypothetical protein